MLVGVDYEDQCVQYELDDNRLVGRWTGPASDPKSLVRDHLREALEHPRGYPPLRQVVVPGDRVVIPLDPFTPNLTEILATLCEVLQDAGVAADAITVLATDSPTSQQLALPVGVALEVHDPSDRSRIAYLASTSSGRRIYLDRLATDADVVVPVGTLSYGPGPLGYRGPWSEVFPGLSDDKTRREIQTPGDLNGQSLEKNRSVAMAEAAEVNWLLGSLFQIGVEVGVSGTTGIIAGHEDMVRKCGVEAVDASWTVHLDEPADLAVAGIGVPWKPTTLDDLAAGLETAARLTRLGGKVVVLSQVSATPGRAIQRLAQVDDPRLGPQALRGLEHEEDYRVALQLATALGRADIYLFSALERDLVEGLGMIPLDNPKDARRLLETCASCVVLSPADWMRAEVEGD